VLPVCSASSLSCEYRVVLSLSVYLVSVCLLGSSVIDWLLKWHFADTRDGACQLAEKLLYHAHILPLLPCHDKKSTEAAPCASKSFCDSTDACYRFVCINISCCMVEDFVIFFS